MADDEQFSLCWNNFNTNLSAGFHESLIRGDLVDVTLAAEGQLVKAHRLILSVCSPYFRKMFTQMPANQHAFIFLKDVSHSALKDLIQFMYCGEVNVKQDALPAFISTAEALQIKGLTETGESAPAQQSPAKDTSHHHLPSSGVTSVPSTASSPRVKPLQRTRIQSYKLDSDDGSSDHEKVVQIQSGPNPATMVAAGTSSGATTTMVHAISAAPQQVQILTAAPTLTQATKRTITQRASITPQTSQVMKRAKMSDPLEASEPAQIQTVQIVKQITQTSAQSTATATVSSEPEYVEMPIETINPKAEPEYADDPSEVEAIDAEHDQDQEQALAEQEHDQEADDSANYVEDETYGDMSKYDESYFTEGDDAKAGASGFGSESYTEGGAADQAAQDKPRIVNDYRNNPEDFELPNPIHPGVSSIKSYGPITKICKETDKSKAECAIAETFIPPVVRTAARSKTRSKRRTALDLDGIVAEGAAHPMIIVPTTKGCVGVSHDDHHFEYHFARQSYRVFRCAWHASAQSCPAQVVAFEKQIFVINDKHTHSDPARIDARVLGKSTLK